MTPHTPSHRCETCKELEPVVTTKYRCRWNLCYVKPHDTCPCKPSHWGEGVPRQKHYLISNTRTGEQYTNVYDPNLNGLQQLCIDAGLSDRLTYCDIECLLTDGETWYMLDECGNWAYLPAWYKVEEVR
jgi:hypothetical protein